MADEELRHLEREALANPTDRAAAWRHARALERSGDRRGYLVATSRLARLGDEEARAVLRDVVALQPVGPRRSQARRCAPLREPWRVRTAHLHVHGHALAATQRVLFVGDHDGLYAIDTERLVERWRRPLVSRFALRGEDVVLGDRDDLVVNDGVTGTELARARLRGFVLQLVADADRAAALVTANSGRLPLVVGLDLGEAFGRELWKRLHREVDPQNRTLFGIADDVVFLRTPLLGLKLEDGTPDPDGTERARRLDYHGHFGDREARLEASCDGWGIAVARDPNVSQTVHDHSAVEVTSPGGTGRRMTLPPLVASSPGARPSRWVRSVALAAPLGYVVSTRRLGWHVGGSDVVNIQAIDLRSAQVCVDVGVPVDLQGEFHTIEAIALDGALLVVVTTPTTCTLIRFEAAPTS